AIRAVVPAIAPAFQRLFKSERGIFRPDPKRFSASSVEQGPQSRCGSRRKLTRQDFEGRMAIVQSSVRVVEEPRLRNQISKLGATEAVLLPVDAGGRASPMQVFKQGPRPLGEFPVKCRVVGNDDIGVGGEVFQCSI